MFQLGLPVAEKMLRPVLVYIFLVLSLRLAGKRELAQLNPFDLVVLLTLSNTVQNAIIGDDSSVSGGVLGAATLLLVNYLVVRFLYRHPALERIVEGDATTLIEGGTLLEDRCHDELVTRAEIQAAAHKQGFATLDEVERAVLEPGGGFTFVATQPTPEVRRHEELLQRLDNLARELTVLRSATAQELVNVGPIRHGEP